MSDGDLGEGRPQGWKSDTLGAICRSGGGSIQTGPFGSQLHAEDYKEDGIPIITVEHLSEGKIVHQNLPLVGKEDWRRLHRYGLIEGDLVFSRVGAIDRCAYVSNSESGWLFSGRCLRVRAGNGEVDSRFLSYLLNSFNQRRWILNHSVGSTMACLNTAILSGVPISHPNFPEQRKIARILTTVDNLIEKTEALIAKYQAIKQGMMHDLFTRGVDSRGHLRPPYEQAPELYKQSELGWIPKAWEDQTISNVLVRRPKNGYSPKESDEWSGVLMLGLGCLTPHGFEPLQLKNAPKNDPNVASALLRDGDLLISRSNTRELVALVGRYRNVGVPCIYSDLMMRLVTTDVILPDYLEALLRHAPVRRQLTSASCGTSGSMMKINSEMVLNTVICVPEKKEQQAILDRLASVSRFIFDAERELEKHKTTKTGLMQDLLTCNVRVKVDEAEEE